MITLKEINSISDKTIPYIQKRKIFELQNIDTLIKTKVATQQKLLVYTVYNTNLEKEKFVELLKLVKKELVDSGFQVDRINAIGPFYIFKISW